MGNGTRTVSGMRIEAKDVKVLLAWFLLCRSRGHATEPIDDPKRLFLGFRDMTDDSTYLAPLRAFKVAQEWLPEEMAKMMLDTEGRRALFGRKGGERGVGPKSEIRELRARAPLTTEILADAFALVEEQDIRVGRVRAHPKDWPTVLSDPGDLDDGLWGAEIYLVGTDLGHVELLDEDGHIRARVHLYR